MKHSAGWDRCVRDVRKKGIARSPEAVCTRVLGKSAYVKGRARNPLPRAGSHELTLIWTDGKGQEHTVFQRFPSAAAARTAARRVTIAVNRQGSHPVRYNVRRRVPFNP
jgi:hypothetical protein